MKIRNFKLYTDNASFLFCDLCTYNIPEFYKEALCMKEKGSFERLLSQTKHTTYIHTNVWDHVKIKVRILTNASKLQTDKWNHVIEASIMLPSRKLIITTASSAERHKYRIKMSGDVYRFRVSVNGLKSIDYEKESGCLNYQIDFWEDKVFKKVNIIKQYTLNS